jgi:NAD(P)-dependent dehydrogenase (short-subunit alcohol dehydrogenase family)
MTNRAHIESLWSLEGKYAIVTGVSTGSIGEGIARTLAAAGARVVVSDIRDNGLSAIANDIGGTAIVADLTTEDDANRLIGTGAAVDVLVNNAGSYFDVGPILKQTPDSWRRAMDNNITTCYNASRAAARRMVDAGKGGSIVNISSVDGLLPCMGTGYDTAKAAVIQFTRSLAVDLAPHDIRVNNIAPGAVMVETLRKMHAGELPPLWPSDTEPTGLMNPITKIRSNNIPLRRRGTPDDIANAVLFLAGAASSYVTGVTLPVDGGWLLI